MEKDRSITGFIPFGVLNADGTMISKDCEITISKSFSVCSCILSHEITPDGIKIITKHESISIQPITSISISLKNE